MPLYTLNFSNKHSLLKNISISMYLLKETILEYIYLKVVMLFNPGL